MKTKTLKFITILILAPVLFSCGNKPTPKCSHSFTDSVVPATCENDGYTLHHCHLCSYEYRSDTIPALGHDYTHVISEVASLENDACDEVVECTRCGSHTDVRVSPINDIDHGVKSFSLGQGFATFEILYGDEFVTLILNDLTESYSGTIYYSFNADYGRFYYQTYKVNFNSNGGSGTWVFSNDRSDGADPYTTPIDEMNIVTWNRQANAVYFDFPYEKYGLNKESGKGKFAFYPRVGDFEYEHINPYVLPEWSETWVKSNGNNRFYYTTKYQNHVVENWHRPDITSAETDFTMCVRGSTPERAIVIGLIAQEKGATNLDFNIVTLREEFRNKENLTKIFHAFKDIGTIAVYYNSAVSHEERVAMLELCVECGAGGIDLQGFIYHSGSTKTTHTPENIAYWEGKGYDMSFIDASPAETIIDPTEDQMHVDLINKVHAAGAKVLGSNHVSTVFSRKQAVAFGRFLNHRGLDIIKVVSHAHNKIDHDETCYANVDAYRDEQITAKFSIHCNNSSTADLSRVVGPLFYHTFMVFHYTYLCHLQMMMELKRSGIEFGDTITVDEAIERIQGKTIDPELAYLISEYRKLDTFEGKAYGKSSDLSSRWSHSGKNTTLLMRDVATSNSFNIRGTASFAEWKGSSFQFETSLSGSFKPHSSTKRIPKFGLFIGDLDKLIGFTYDYITDSNGNLKKAQISIRYNSYKFAYDTETKDSLSNNLIEPIEISSDITSGGIVKLKISYAAEGIGFYYSESSLSDYILAKAFSYAELSEYFTNENGLTKVGNLAEAYMGSNSVGTKNVVGFINTFNK